MKGRWHSVHRLEEVRFPRLRPTGSSCDNSLAVLSVKSRGLSFEKAIAVPSIWMEKMFTWNVINATIDWVYCLSSWQRFSSAICWFHRLFARWDFFALRDSFSPRASFNYWRFYLKYTNDVPLEVNGQAHPNPRGDSSEEYALVLDFKISAA